jgi:MFS family permease
VCGYRHRPVQTWGRSHGTTGGLVIHSAKSPATSSQDTAGSEWRRHWRLPIATALGYATAVLHVYGIGAFILPLQHEFGWSRAFISSGLTIAGGVAAIAAVPVGALVDRIGARRVALFGVPLTTSAFALLGTASGSTANWMLLWFVLALANIGLQSTVWMSFLSAAFDRSRGLAIAVTVSGASVGAFVYPLLATWLIGRFGLRLAFMGVGGIWLAIVLPTVFAFFRDPQPTSTDQQHTKPRLSSLQMGEDTEFRRSTLCKLAAAGGIIAFMSLGITVHFVPILTGRGAAPSVAAGIASLIGIFSIAGRMGTGILLDRVPGHIVGAIACTLPMIASMLLVFGGGPSTQVLAAACFGLTIGSEIDVVAYLGSRHFSGPRFSLRFGTVNAALATGTALGPIAAGYVFDRLQSYVPFLWLSVVLMAVCFLLFLSLSRPPIVIPGSGRATSDAPA